MLPLGPVFMLKRSRRGAWACRKVARKGEQQRGPDSRSQGMTALGSAYSGSTFSSCMACCAGMDSITLPSCTLATVSSEMMWC